MKKISYFDNLTSPVDVGYIRESTEEQALGTHALEQQLARIMNFGILEQLVFCDVDSGAKTDRPELTQLLDLVRQGKIKRIVATRWDRLTRNQELYLQFKKLIQDCDVELILLDQGIVDLGTASGEFFADIQVLFAIQERRMIKERVKRGFEHRRNQLKAPGRTPWGYLNYQDKYKLDRTPCICLLEQRPENYLELVQEPDDSNKLIGLSRADIGREAVELFLKYRKPRKALGQLYKKYNVPQKVLYKSVDNKQVRVMLITAKELLFWLNGDSFKNWLINPVLEGHTAYKKTTRNRYNQGDKPWDIRYDTHPDERLISEQEATAIREIIEFNGTRHVHSKGTFYLTGLVFCKQCGYKCILKRLCARNLAYYGCRYSSAGCGNRKCVRIEKIEQAIIKTLFSRANQAQTPANAPPADSQLSSQALKLKEQLAGLDNIPGIDSNPLLKQAQKDLRQQIAELEKQYQQCIPTDGTAQQVINHPQARNINYWHTLTQMEREIFYSKLVERVVISDGEITSVSLKV